MLRPSEQKATCSQVFATLFVGYVNEGQVRKTLLATDPNENTMVTLRGGWIDFKSEISTDPP